MSIFNLLHIRSSTGLSSKTSSDIAEVHEERHDLTQANVAGMPGQEETPVFTAHRMQ
jgi:hypothetical protein